MAVPSVSTAYVRAAVRAMIGREVTGCSAIEGSVANQDFLVVLEHEAEAVVKIGARDELAAEAWACRRLEQTGVPVPKVVAFEPEGPQPSLSVLILGFVRGEPSADPRVARQAGRVFREVHSVELGGWGPLIVPTTDGAVAHGRYRSGQEAIDGGLQGVQRLVDAGVIDQALADVALDVVGGGDELSRYAGPGVLLHRDLKVEHLFADTSEQGPRLAAVIDWGDASVGDPLVDLARLSMAGPDLFRAFLDGYGADMTLELQDRLAHHRVVWNLTALSYEFEAGGDWFDTYRNGVYQDVALLSRRGEDGA